MPLEVHSVSRREQLRKPSQSVSAETTPLLSSPRCKSDLKTWSQKQEFKSLISASCTITAGYLLQQCLQVASIFVVGRLGPVELSIAAFSYMIATSTAWLLAIGGTTAIDSLGSASQGNGENPVELGILLQKYLITVSGIFVPVATLWYFIAPILLLFRIPSELAFGTQTFLRCMSPSALGYILFEALKKFMQCQNIRAPSTVILLITSILNIPWSYLLVHTLNWGLAGGAIATGSMYWLSAILALGYIYFVDGSQAWGGWSAKCLVDLGTFFKVVFLGVVGIGAEWWAFEIITIGAGSMGELTAAAQSIVMTTDTILALFPLGLGIAATNRVANLVGSGQISQACFASRVASILAVANGCVATVILLVFRRHISALYTDDLSVVDLAVTVFPWAAAFQVADGLQCVNAGSLRAIGKVDLAAYINLVAYYVLAIPLSLMLAFKADLGLSGLWIGLAAALTMAGGTELAVVTLTWSRMKACGHDEEDDEDGC